MCTNECWESDEQLERSHDDRPEGPQSVQIHATEVHKYRISATMEAP